ncbi:MAG TPA: hypothetical protein VFK34_09385 [Marmoricola sp.]|jgi:hypothetical protein|nr:hypothetical protein [Marmoricola sp.]
MSKMDDLRAMREARYAQAQKRAGAKPAGERRVRTAPERAAPREAAPETSDGAPEVALCGHRNMSGRTCTREQGHAAKSHRYS